MCGDVLYSGPKERQLWYKHRVAVSPECGGGLSQLCEAALCIINVACRVRVSVSGSAVALAFHWHFFFAR